MMKAMLDTNILIYAARNNPPEILERLGKFRKGDIAISSIVWAEFCVGLHKSGIDAGQVDAFIDIIAFDKAAGDVFGMLTAKYPDRARGFDRLIAAHAIAAKTKLITNNVADFAPYLDDGLALENWAAPR